MEKEIRSYFECRFPRASSGEKEKFVDDWKDKIPQGRAVVLDFAKRVCNPRGMRLIDAGSGMGGASIAFVEAGADVIGVEIDSELVQMAKKTAARHNTSPSFVMYSGERLPFSDDMFDGAVSISVLEHVSDPVNFLSEIRRVIKPGGAFYLAFPNRFWPKETHTGLWGITYLPRSLAALVIALFKRSPLEDNNLHFYTYWDFKKMLKAVGWKLKEEKGESNNILKITVKKILGAFGIPYKAFLPHISVILEK